MKKIVSAAVFIATTAIICANDIEDINYINKFLLNNLYFKSSLSFKEDFKVIDARFIRNENSKRFKINLKNQWNP